MFEAELRYHAKLARLDQNCLVEDQDACDRRLLIVGCRDIHTSTTQRYLNRGVFITGQICTSSLFIHVTQLEPFNCR